MAAAGGRRPPVAQARVLDKEADTGGSGTIDFDEFMESVTRSDDSAANILAANAPQQWRGAAAELK